MCRLSTIRIIKNKHIINEKLGGMEQDALMRHIDEAKKMCVNISPKSAQINLENDKTNKKKGNKTRKETKQIKEKLEKVKVEAR